MLAGICRSGLHAPQPGPRVVSSSVQARAVLAELDPGIVVTIPFHDASDTLPAAIESIRGQVCVRGRMSILLVDDGSRDGWRCSTAESLAGYPAIVISDSRRRGPAAARNHALRLARSAPNVRLIVRLDADDILHDRTTLHRIEVRMRRSVFSLRTGLSKPRDILLCSNLQRQDGRVLEAENRAEDQLLRRATLLERVEGMSLGDFGAELPSCNLVFRPWVRVSYPQVSSAEDHWVTVMLLARQPREVSMAEDILHTVYTLSGSVTRQNMSTDAYSESRKALWRWLTRWAGYRT